MLDHYETKTKSHTERVQDGSHVEYSYKDNGDGTFTEISHTVPDYKYETVYEEYQSPVYRDEPVYRTKYYYKAWRWVCKETVENTGGAGEDPSYGDIESHIAGDEERKGRQEETYWVCGYYDGDELNMLEFEVDRDHYEVIGVGDDIKILLDRVDDEFVGFANN